MNSKRVLIIILIVSLLTLPTAQAKGGEFIIESCDQLLTLISIGIHIPEQALMNVCGAEAVDI